MKLLIAYDGSKCSEAALDDLRQAGLPKSGTARIISVAEVWLPPPGIVDEGEIESEYIGEIVTRHRQRSEKLVNESSVHARDAEARVRIALPGWNVKSSATYGSPAWEILAMADEFQTDLIVVGSHGRSALSRFFLGSISQKVLTEAHCSVRIARGKNVVDPTPARVIVGFDGSRGAVAAVDEIRRRSWPAHSEFRLVAATEPVSPSSITRFVPPVARMVEEVNVAEEHWIDRLADKEIAKLRMGGLDAHLHIHPGNPKDILVQEAERWGADSIFVGANAHAALMPGVALGSTSAAVAARAHCSVEVVRVRPVRASKSNGNSA